MLICFRTAGGKQAPYRAPVNVTWMPSFYARKNVWSALLLTMEQLSKQHDLGFSSAVRKWSLCRRDAGLQRSVTEGAQSEYTPNPRCLDYFLWHREGFSLDGPMAQRCTANIQMQLRKILLRYKHRWLSFPWKPP